MYSWKAELHGSCSLFTACIRVISTGTKFFIFETVLCRIVHNAFLAYFSRKIFQWMNLISVYQIFYDCHHVTFRWRIAAEQDGHRTGIATSGPHHSYSHQPGRQIHVIRIGFDELARMMTGSRPPHQPWNAWFHPRPLRPVALPSPCLLAEVQQGSRPGRLWTPWVCGLGVKNWSTTLNHEWSLSNDHQAVRVSRPFRLSTMEEQAHAHW